VAGGGGWLGLIGWWSGDSGRGTSCLCQILPVTGSRIGTTMSISGKKCAKYEARLAQIEAIPWSTKLAIPKNTARSKKRLSIIVASFYRSFERSATSEADSQAKSLFKSFLAFLLAGSP